MVHLDFEVIIGIKSSKPLKSEDNFFLYNRLEAE